MHRLLLQTTIEDDPDDWNIDRFGLLRTFLEELRDEGGRPAFAVVARNRAKRGGPDPVLSSLDAAGFDQLWLFAVDGGQGLGPEECAGISKFRDHGGALLVTRDRSDPGNSISSRLGLEDTYHFHARDCEPDTGDHRADHPLEPLISWPCYRSGADGDFQRVRAVGNIHPVMRDKDSPTGVIRYLPAHPCESAVSAPQGDQNARVIMAGQSSVTNGLFNIAVAFERFARGGRAIAQSTFHHFADYNWDTACGCPSFVSEPPGDGMRLLAEALRSTKQYVRNVAFWLAGEDHA